MSYNIKALFMIFHQAKKAQCIINSIVITRQHMTSKTEQQNAKQGSSMPNEGNQ